MYSDEQVELLLNVEPEQAIELQKTGWNGRKIRKQPEQRWAIMKHYYFGKLLVMGRSIYNWPFLVIRATVPV